MKRSGFLWEVYVNRDGEYIAHYFDPVQWKETVKTYRGKIPGTVKRFCEGKRSTIVCAGNKLWNLYH